MTIVEDEQEMEVGQWSSEEDAEQSVNFQQDHD